MRVEVALLLVLGCVAAGPIAASVIDGRPRPYSFSDTPSMSYGRKPLVYDPHTKARISCSWYGWESLRYPTLGSLCAINMRVGLLNETKYPSGSHEAFVYYYISPTSDPADSDCVQGCFILEGDSSTPSDSGTGGSSGSKPSGSLALTPSVLLLISLTTLIFSMIW